MKNTESISPLETTHFGSFIKSFAPSKALQEKWTYFFEKHTPIHWTGVEPWVFWNHQNNRYLAFELDSVSHHEIYRNHFIASNIQRINDVVVVACGHSDPKVMTMSSDVFFAIDPIELPLEYIASFIPGKLAIVTNHDGQTLLLIIKP